jgi:hypothetical protein
MPENTAQAAPQAPGDAAAAFLDPEAVRELLARVDPLERQVWLFELTLALIILYAQWKTES